MENTVIEVKNLTKQFMKQKAVNYVSFRINQGMICGLIRQNGAGKTTIMKMLGGFVLSTSGEIMIFGGSSEQVLREKIGITGIEMFGGTYAGSLSFMAAGESASMLSVMIICMFTTRLCGWDFNDKTINYEIMYGHSRSEVCFARIISAVLFSSVIGFILPMFPILIFTIANGEDVIIFKDILSSFI